MKKKTLQEVKETFSQNGCELLENEYINNSKKMKFRCCCGQESKITLNQFIKNPKCRDCGIEQMKKSKNKGDQPCRRCGDAQILNRENYGNICKECYNKEHAQFQSSHREQYYAKNRDKHIEYLRKRMRDNPELVRSQSNASYHKVRFEVLSHYSPDLCCVKCGFNGHISALSIDHINGDGADHRRQLGGSNMYRWIKNNDFPNTFQVLCMNCQFIKAYENKERPGAPKKIT